MPWIAPEQKVVRDTLSLKFDVVVLRQLARYATFLHSTQSYIVTEILRDVFARDKDFQAWLRAQDAASCEPQDDPHGDPHDTSAHDPSAATPVTVKTRSVPARRRQPDATPNGVSSDEQTRGPQEAGS